MKITMSQIANVVGVSRGTVDRALHNRKGVNPQIAEQILTVAKELGYRPNFAAQALKQQKKLKLGFALPQSGGFWQDVSKGIDQAVKELEDCNTEIYVRRFTQYNGADELQCLNELMELGVDGLAVVPINDLRIKTRLAEISASGVPVIFVNQELNDAEDVNALCYIGSDYVLSGRTAAGILKLCHHKEKIELGIFSGSKNMHSQSTRITGFLQEMERLGLNFHLIDIISFSRSKADAGNDNVPSSYDISLNFLKKHPEATALFTAGGPAHAVAKAIYDSGRADSIIHVAFDLHDVTNEWLQNGGITVIIGQESSVQGYMPLKMLFDYCINHIEPKSKRILVHNEIIIPQNGM